MLGCLGLIELHMERYTYPHTIENGAGARLTFLRRVPSRAGDQLEVENIVQPGAGPRCTLTTARKKP